MRRERDFMLPGRSVAIGDRGMVSTSHAAASIVALDILKEGGNAVDASIAAVAMQCVVEPHMTGIGGDCFAILAGPDGKIVAVNGSGRAPQAAELDWFLAQGLTSVPDASAHAVTVPGSVDAWCGLAAGYGRLGLERALSPAIAAAEEGFIVTQRTAADWSRYAHRIAAHGNNPVFLPAGIAPTFGDRMAHPALGATLRAIAREGRKAFYEGAVAEEMVSCLKALGGLHDLRDFVESSADEVAPICAEYRGYQLYECPPNGQGLAALMIARILAGFDLGDAQLSEADRIHLLAEATKAAYRQRDRLVADPAFHHLNVEEALSDASIASLSAPIKRDRALDGAAWGMPVHRDTVQVAVVDRDGMAVSIINSIFSAFGSGIYAPRSGVLLQDRGAGFSLHRGHPNALAPRKRPFHTIIPAMLMKDGRPVMPFGVVGAQYQAVGHMQILMQMLDLGCDAQQASDAPRSFAFDGVLSLEPTQDAGVAADLDGRGHRVAWSKEPIGGFQGVWIDHARGVYCGAADQRKDGIAIGI